MEMCHEDIHRCSRVDLADCHPVAHSDRKCGPCVPGETFDAVICAVMPTPAYPHDHSPEQEKRRIDGKEYVYPDQLAWPGIATLPGLPSTAISDRLRAGRTAGRRADRRALAGGPDAAEAGRTDRARIRRLRSAKDV